MQHRELYPEIEPFDSYRLKVSPLHEIYVEEVGNPKGKPVVFLHGGPGAGCTTDHRRFFDPKHYRVFLFDQRGCGRSTPHAELKENTTQLLIQDIETIRKRAGVDQWIVFGGSWGSTLALCYAIAQPKQVKALALRGIFLCRPSELHWFYQEGASQLFPDLWEEFLKPIPPAERSNLMQAYHKRMTGSDRKAAIEAARAWSIWEGATSYLKTNTSHIGSHAADEFALAFSSIEAHYFVNNIFYPGTNYILDNIEKIKSIPCEIVHGRYDVVCPLTSAWDLHKRYTNSQLSIIPDAGHSVFEPGIRSKLIHVMDQWRV
jgi:proline iminopeptidase